MNRLARLEHLVSRTSATKDRAVIQQNHTFSQLFATLVECSDILKAISPAKRRPWLVHVLDEIYQRQNGRCACCAIKLESHEVDHIVPFAYGGGNERANLQLLCRPCNRSKGASVEPSILLRYLEDRVMNLG